MPQTRSRFAQLLKDHESEILEDWLRLQTIASQQSSAVARVDDRQRRDESKRMLNLLREAAMRTENGDISDPEWDDLRSMLADLARARATQGFSPTEIAYFILSMKQPIFSRLRGEISDANSLADEIWTVTLLLDQLGLHSMEVYQHGREDVIRRQQQEMMELSTPVVQL